MLSVFRGYGNGVFIPEAIDEIAKLCEDFGLRVRGIDKAITYKGRLNGGDDK